MVATSLGAFYSSMIIKIAHQNANAFSEHRHYRHRETIDPVSWLILKQIWVLHLALVPVNLTQISQNLEITSRKGKMEVSVWGYKHNSLIEEFAAHGCWFFNRIRWEARRANWEERKIANREGSWICKLAPYMPCAPRSGIQSLPTELV